MQFPTLARPPGGCPRKPSPEHLSPEDVRAKPLGKITQYGYQF